uniref:Uncharacterized protein n=1 Tax=Octopus bimaculoides TaxID=37653 RepID=A0A0L8FMR9_OCTBM
MSTYGTPRSTVPNNLRTANFVFVRHDTRRKPLQLPYDGPYQVIQPGDKSFELLIGGQDRVTIDRLKPLHLDIDSPVQVAQPPNRGVLDRSHQPLTRNSHQRTE